MSTSATLLLREANSSAPLTALVAQSHHNPSPHPYTLTLHRSHLTLTPTLLPLPSTPSPPPPTLPQPDEGFESDIDSLSLVSSDGSEPPAPKTETDSAHGSSDSDTDTPPSPAPPHSPTTPETFPIGECLCYTDIHYHRILLFVIRSQVLVFRFDDPHLLRTFYLNFTALKAVTNPQLTLNRPASKQFNLLQRTDRNGVTHIEIRRQFGPQPPPPRPRQRTASTENLLEPDGGELRKVWTSVDDLLAPQRPERRKKGRAPPPPAATLPRPRAEPPLIVKSHQTATAEGGRGLGGFFNARGVGGWVGRGREEGRGFTPMAYRYIDTVRPEGMGGRLFGLSGKLREMGGEGERWGSYCKPDNCLKSVIKKDEGRKKSRERGEKKVTFSAYTTVQVV